MPSSAPGPVGLPYAFWAAAPLSVLEYVDDLAEATTLGEALPRDMLASNTVWLPRGEYLEDATKVMRRVRAPAHHVDADQREASCCNSEPGTGEHRRGCGGWQSQNSAQTE